MHPSHLLFTCKHAVQVRSAAAVVAGAALEQLRVPTAAAAIHVEHALRLAVQLVGPVHRAAVQLGSS